MAVNDKITATDYNNIRGPLANIIGTGTADSGWGQTVISSAVSEGTKVTATQITRLRNDIINAHTHIFGTAPTPVSVVEHDVVKFNATTSPVSSYTALVSNINANRFTVAGGQSAVQSYAPSSTTWPGIYGTNWTSLITCTITATWPTAAAARHFWNSGGQLRITASRSGGTGSAQNNAWTSILSTAGTRTFAAQTPSAGVAPNDGQNWFRCSNTRQLWYSVSGSSPYGSNSYKLYARTTDALSNSNSSGSASQGEWFIEFVDNYVDPGQHPSNPVPDTVDSVDGTFTVAVEALYATGILIPLGTGNFSVTLPTISTSAISP
jgi:hypothetical protein